MGDEMRTPNVELQLRSLTPPLILGLFEHLPEAGSVWPDEERDAWLRLAAAIFAVLYVEES